jgi:phage-related protein
MDKIKANLQVLSIEIGEKLAPYVARFTDALVTGFSNVDEIVATVKDTAIDFAKKVKEKATPVIKGIADAFEAVSEKGLEVYDTIYNYLAPGIENLYDKVRELVELGLQKIVDLFNQIDWGQAFDTLTAAAERAREEIMEFVRDIPNKFRDARDKLIEIIDDINKKIQTFIEFVKRNADQILVLAGAIGGLVIALGLYKISLIVAAGVTAAWSAITTAATAVGLAFVAVQAAMAAPLLIVIALFAAVAGALVVAYFRFEEVRDIVDSVGRFFMNYFWPTVKAVFEFIMDIIKVWVDMFVETAKMIWNLITGDFAGAFDNLKNLVGIAIDAVVAFFVALPGKLLATYCRP